MYSEEVDDNLQIIPIRDKLTKMLGDLVPEVHDEVAAAFEDEFPLNGEGGSSPSFTMRSTLSSLSQSGSHSLLFRLSSI